MYVHVQHAQHPDDREQVYRFRYRVLVEELGQTIPGADHKRRRIHDQLDDSARLLVALDEQSGAIVGSLRCNLGSDRPLDPGLVQALNLGPMVHAVGADCVSHTSAFVVDPSFRGETIASTMVTQLYSVALAKRILVDTLACEPALASSYHQLGYRPFGEPITQRGETRLPLAMVLRHGAYFFTVKSPLAMVTYHPQGAGVAVAKRLEALYPLFREQDVAPQKPDSFWAGLAHVNAPAKAPSLFEGIEPVDYERILAGLPRLRMATDRRLDEVAEERPGMGMVLSGRLGVTADLGPRPFFVSVLRPGEVFGQMAGFAATERDPKLVALEDCEVLLLPQDLPELMERESPKLAAQLRKNLAAILVFRLESTNRQVAGFMSGSPQRVVPEVTPPPQEPVAPAAEEAVALPAAPPQEAAPKAPREPAIPLSQVIPPGPEARWLKRVGLRDGSTILVLDDGTGEGALRLARILPRTRVVGATTPQALAVLQARCEEAGVSERCTLIPLTKGSLPLRDSSVDHAWLRFALHQEMAPEPMLGEVLRVLRPGGTVAALDLDDGGLMVQPEPAGLQALLARAEALLEGRGSRRVGRRLCHLLEQAGLERAHSLVLPLLPGSVPMGQLLSATFGPVAELLHDAGAWTAEDKDVLADLVALAAREDAWLCVPVICAAARLPAHTEA